MSKVYYVQSCYVNLTTFDAEMFRNLIILSLLILLMPLAFAKHELVLNLDNSVNAEILPTAKYYSDPQESLNFRLC